MRDGKKQLGVFSASSIPLQRATLWYSALLGCNREKSLHVLLHVAAGTFRTPWLAPFVFADRRCLREFLPALFAFVLVGWHSIAPHRSLNQSAFTYAFCAGWLRGSVAAIIALTEC